MLGKWVGAGLRAGRRCGGGGVSGVGRWLRVALASRNGAGGAPLRVASGCQRLQVSSASSPSQGSGAGGGGAPVTRTALRLPGDSAPKHPGPCPSAPENEPQETAVKGAAPQDSVVWGHNLWGHSGATQSERSVPRDSARSNYSARPGALSGGRAPAPQRAGSFPRGAKLGPGLRSHCRRMEGCPGEGGLHPSSPHPSPENTCSANIGYLLTENHFAWEPSFFSSWPTCLSSPAQGHCLVCAALTHSSLQLCPNFLFVFRPHLVVL